MELMEAHTAAGLAQSISKGFKQTEVGLIPEDWGLESLFEICGEDKARFNDGDWIESEFIEEEGIRLIQTNNVGEGFFINNPSNKKFITSDTFRKLKCKSVLVGDLLVSRLADPAGRACIVPRLTEDEMITSVDVTIVRPREDKAISGYLVQLFSTTDWFNRVSERTGGTTHKRIARSALGQMMVACPPIREQQAIAEALSDMDAMIRQLEQLIEKKKAIKQGAMQELLKPKEGWVLKRLGDVFQIGHGKNQKLVEDQNGQYPILGTGGFMAWANSYLYDKPSALIGRKGTIDVPQYMDSPFWTVDTLYYTKVKECNSPKFIFYLFHTINWYSYNEASGVPSLNASTIENIEKHFPETEEEQLHIAGMLTDIDDEIQVHEQKLTKARQLKHGMMQELLTGRKRLV